MESHYHVPKITHIFLVIALISSLLIIAGYYYYIKEQDNIRQQKQKELKAVAELKINQISEWYKDEIIDANTISHNTNLVAKIENYINKQSKKEKVDLVEIINEIKSEHDYDGILIATPNAKTLASTNYINKIDSVIIEKIHDLAKTDSVISTDLFRSIFRNNRIYIAFLTPVYSKNNNQLAVIVFFHYANNFLYPLIQYWPIPSQTSETFILRKEQNKVLYLSELKNEKNTALRFWLPITRKELPAVQAALGKKGIFKGKDTRNIDIYAFISPINGTPWFMVTKIDEAELMEGLYTEAKLIIILIILSIFFIGTGISFYYNYRQKNIYKELYNREKELWQSEEKFKVTLESLGDGVITTDTNGNIQYLNKRAEELTGFTIQEAKGKKLSEVYYAKNEQTGERENNIIDKVLKQGIIKELGNHTIMVSRDGKNIPVRDSGAPIFDSDGLLIGLVLTFQDETEKRFQINLLKESEEKYRTVVEIASDAIFITLNNSIVFVNNATIELFGAQSPEQIIGKSPFEFFHPVYHEKARERINLMIEKGVRYSNIEEKIIRLDGKIIDVEVSAITFIYKDSHAFQVVLRDITKRKRIEEQREMAVTALRESEDRYFQLLNTAPIGILVVSDEKITFVNPAAVHLFGADSNEQVLDKLLIDFVHPDNRSVTKERIARVIKGEKNLYPVENKYIKMDGTPINLEVLLTPLIYQGKYSMQVLLNDITERKIMINDLITAKEKAEEINKVKSNFFANMSHELRTPFVGIMGYAELLMESLSEPEYKEMAEGILSTSKRMKDTLTKILNLSKYEFSGIEINPKIIDLQTIINDIYKHFVKAAEKKNLLFKTMLSSEPINIETDDSVLTEILNNLINNSIIYTNTGTIEISAEKQIKDNNKIVLIKVSDTGIGIPKDKQDIIWEEFRQVSEGTTRSYQGTGLGLTIAKKYTNLLGGNIYMESEEGKGSTFFLELPVSNTTPLQNSTRKNDEENTASVVFDSSEEINYSKKNILCVEDDLIARDVIKLALSKTYNIELAKDAENALAIVREKNFDALMIDINLGKGINGLELTEKIKEIPNYNNTPIIAVTAYASEDDKNEFLSKGMSHYISKPFLIKDILKLLEEVFSRR